MSTPPECCGGARARRAGARPRRPGALLGPGLSLVLGALAVLAPKCPMCLAAYLSLVGLGFSAAGFVAPLLLPLGTASIAIALATLAGHGQHERTSGRDRMLAHLRRAKRRAGGGGASRG